MIEVWSKDPSIGPRTSLIVPDSVISKITNSKLSKVAGPILLRFELRVFWVADFAGGLRFSRKGSETDDLAIFAIDTVAVARLAGPIFLNTWG